MPTLEEIQEAFDKVAGSSSAVGTDDDIMAAAKIVEKAIEMLGDLMAMEMFIKISYPSIYYGDMGHKREEAKKDVHD